MGQQQNTISCVRSCVLRYGIIYIYIYIHIYIATQHNFLNTTSHAYCHARPAPPSRDSMHCMLRLGNYILLLSQILEHKMEHRKLCFFCKRDLQLDRSYSLRVLLLFHLPKHTRSKMGKCVPTIFHACTLNIVCTQYETNWHTIFHACTHARGGRYLLGRSDDKG